MESTFGVVGVLYFLAINTGLWSTHCLEDEDFGGIEFTDKIVRGK